MPRLFGLGNEPKTFEFKCDDCGQIHRGSPSFSYAEPVEYFGVPELERETRVRFSPDFCVIDETDFLMRGLLEIPIVGADEPFLWGVWVLQSEESFTKFVDSFDDDQSGLGSFGWLGVCMNAYRRTAAGEPIEYLACNVLGQSGHQRPAVVIQECDHPLYRDQRDGISWDRAVEIARDIMHG